MKKASLDRVPQRKPPLIAMLTDFGLTDPFVGMMKGVIASIAPGAQIVDLTHEIPPGDISRGAVTIWQSRPYFPPGTIFLGVVDPGVGTARRPVLVNSKDQIFIGPDNGLFTFLLGDKYQAWELRNPQLALPGPGKTFHGRDIFAPAAAYAANGIPAPEFGPSAGPLICLPPAHLSSPAPETLQGEVLYPDRFGNLLTSLGRFVALSEGFYKFDPWISGIGTGAVQEASKVRFQMKDSRLSLPDSTTLHWVATFAEVPSDGCAFLVGSSGLLEIVACQRSAAQILDLHPGEKVTLRLQGER